MKEKKKQLKKDGKPQFVEEDDPEMVSYTFKLCISVFIRECLGCEQNAASPCQMKLMSSAHRGRVRTT